MSTRVVQIGKFGKAQVKFPREMALGTSYVPPRLFPVFHFSVVQMPSMRGPRVYQLNFIIKRKKGDSQPLLGTSDPEKMGRTIRVVPTASNILTVSKTADAAAFETTWHDRLMCPSILYPLCA
jgi:hypothetical protein